MRRNYRRGFSLIEVSTVIGVSAVITGMAVWLVHASMLKSRDGQRRLATQNTISRLAETFRRDAHAATAVVEEKTAKKGEAGVANHPAWTMKLADGREVRYKFESGSLMRSEFASAKSPKEGSEKDSPKPLNRDCFELPPGTTVSIQLDQPSQSRISTLLLSHAKNASESPPKTARPLYHPLRIDAAIGTDARFDKITTQADKKAVSGEDKKK